MRKKSAHPFHHSQPGKGQGKKAASTPSATPRARNSAGPDPFMTQLRQAMQAQQAGQLTEAEAGYRGILARNPRHAQALLYLGTVFHVRRQYVQALELIEQAHAAGANDEAYYINAGLCQYNLGHTAEAAQLLEQAVRLAPQAFEAQFNLGNSYYRLKRFGDAARCYEKANELNPGVTLIEFQLACSYQDNRQFDLSVQWFQKVLAKEPDNARANCGYAMTLLRMYRKEEGMQYGRRAVELDPNNAVILYNFAHVLRATGMTADAEDHFRRALEIQPEAVEALLGLGRLLSDTGRYEESIPYLDRAIAADPNYHSAYSSRGMACMKNDALGAVEWFDKALAIKPDADEVMMLKGYALNILGRPAEAEACLRRAIELNPHFAEHYQNLGNVLVAQGRVAESLEVNRKAIELNPGSNLIFSNILLYMHYVAQSQRPDLWRMHQIFNQLYTDRLGIGRPPVHYNPRDPEKRLRIGLVSSDFRRHSCAYFLDPLLRRHDRDQFEIIGYSSVKSPDAFTELLRSNCSGWRDILKLSDQQAAQVIYDDHVDILIDLSGHTADNRLVVFMYKPAPVQAAWLGYPDTTGLPAIDYRITDEIADPPETEAMSSEKLVYLPGGFHCYGAFPDSPAVEPSPVHANGFVTFGSFNNFAKVSDETVFLWAEILKNVPGSKLLLKSLGLGDEVTQELIRKRFADRGITSDRLEILGKTKRISDHLNMYAKMDIALDTYPYNGTTTTIEALYMGVPVLSMNGGTHASLVGKSLLTHVGLEELACAKPEEFIRKGIALASNLPLLTQIRETMRERMLASPLLDEEGFARKMEAAWREMWRAFCRTSPVAPVPPAVLPPQAQSQPQPPATAQPAATELTLNFGASAPATSVPPSPQTTSSDGLALNFGSPAPAATPPQPNASQPSAPPNKGLKLNFGSQPPAPAAPNPPQPPLTGDGLTLKF